MAQWSLDLREYAKKKGVEIKDVQKSYAFAVYASVVKKTPVDTGRARGNWNVSVGHEDTSTDDPSGYKTSYRKRQKKNANEGKKTIRPPAKLKYSDMSSIPDPNGDESIFISNNLPYITALEYGSSQQAPAGMVGVTLANNERIFDAAVRAVTGGRQ